MIKVTMKMRMMMMMMTTMMMKKMAMMMINYLHHHHSNEQVNNLTIGISFILIQNNPMAENVTELILSQHF